MVEEPNGHGKNAASDNETRHARFPSPHPSPARGEGDYESLYEFHVKTEFSQQVGDKAARKLKAQRHATQTVWSGLGMMGLIGWSVAMPTLLGAALGLWLDKHHPGSHSWTLMLLAIGLGLGCFNAWHWVNQEQQEIQRENKHE